MSKNLPKDAVEVAYISKPIGVQGALCVKPFSQDADALFKAKKWYLQPSERSFKPLVASATAGGRQAIAQSRQLEQLGIMPVATQLALPDILTITQIEPHKEGVSILAEEVQDRSLAERLKGYRIYIPRAEFPPLKEGEYYWVDLIGLQVHNLEGVALGQVKELMTNGAQDILKIEGVKQDTPSAETKVERLIPFVRDVFIKEVDLQQQTILVDWQEDY